ncbi:MAG TPA: hypothetical protein VJR92_08565 [Gemmatimonadaceae bacterium]|nr:hypothetical protein [Gemmatimonadaceae bacterium]
MQPFHRVRYQFHADSRTLENWEQGRARPNAQAALLIRLVRRYPDALQRLANLSCRASAP